jgi:hypothetical protein
VRASTRPSPPLFPPPQAQTTRPTGKSRATTCAAARPADSISTRSGTPAVSMAERSQAAISAAVSTGRWSRAKDGGGCVMGGNERGPGWRARGGVT